LWETDDDAMLARFGRARSYDFDQTKAMLDTFLKWRAEKKVHEIQLTPDLEKFLKYQTVVILPKTDKFGRSIMFLQPRYHNPNVRDWDISMNAFYWAISNSINRMKPPLENYVAITDLNGYGLRNNDWSLMKTQSDDLQNYYPERLGVSFIINSPWYISSVWKVVSRWLDEKTRRKMHFLGKDFKETLLEVIDEDSLPEALGGKLHLNTPELNMWGVQSTEDSQVVSEKDVEKEIEKQVSKKK